ncbi:MAG TPA: hypothetical protein VFB52_01685 [Solirubrobacterales bacterium]|nr:hypothetical protein [Solirubrobacterales bacterium]
MAQTKKRQKGKKRGTQGGRVDSKPRGGRPRSREEAKQRASSKRSVPTKGDQPPTWRNSVMRGLFAAVVFFVLLLLLFKKPIGSAATFSAFMLAFYIPAGYYIDMFLWRKRERARIRARQQGK